MKKIYVYIISVLISSVNASAQSGTFAKVYTTFQNSCAFSGCHNNANVSSGLNLVGTGDSEAEMMTEVYNNLYNKPPKNAFAVSKGYKLVNPGDPYTSFLFRKSHGNLKGDDLALHEDEGEPMPQKGIPLEDKDAEIIRQWILYGAPIDEDVVDTALIGKYYREGGIVSASNPPKAPDAGKGFQIHMGPFFLAPRAETEFFAKYDPQLKQALEVNEIEAYMGQGYSHHFILFRYKDDEKHAKPWGLRKDNAHLNTEMVSAHQESQTVPLPPGTAFPWAAGSYLDLNTHYINYSTTKILAAEVYVNVYTQTAGTARQIMYSALIPNTKIYIPNDGKEHTFTQVFDAENSFLWTMTSHTHKYGKDYDVYIVNPDNTLGEQIFEGSCKNGIPGCTNTNYDYQHPPIRRHNPFLPIISPTGQTKIAHRAKYVNNGDKPVGFGGTTEDEMMVLLAMYVKDTTGLGELALSTAELPKSSENLSAKFFPNPVSSTATILYTSSEFARYEFVLTDAAGRVLQTQYGATHTGENRINIEAQNFPKGIYFYSLILNNGNRYSGKVSKL
ncbi:MAG: T9SS type A sorting domain-containing protein [Bacteroidia bacterium]